MARTKRTPDRISYQQILNLKAEVYAGILSEAERLHPAEYDTAKKEADKALEKMMEYAHNLPAFHLCDYLYWLQLAVQAHFIANEFNEYGVIIDGKVYSVSDDF